MSSQQRLVKSYFCTISVFVQFSLFKKSVHGPGPKPFYKNKKVSMDLVHDRGSMERSKVGVHGPLVHVLSFGSKAITGSSFKFEISHRSFACWQTDLCEFGRNFGGGSAIQRVYEWRPPKFSPSLNKWHEPQLAG